MRIGGERRRRTSLIATAVERAATGPDADWRDDRDRRQKQPVITSRYIRDVENARGNDHRLTLRARASFAVDSG